MARALAEHEQRFKRVAHEAERVVESARAAIDERRESERTRLQRRLAETLEASRRAARAEFDEASTQTTALAAEASGIRVGGVELPIPGASQKLKAPVILPFLDEGHIIVSAPGERRDEALGAIAGILRHALASRPPGEVRYRIFDPIGTGASLSAFGDFDRERIAHGLPLSDGDGLREAVAELSRHATVVSSTYLRGKYRCLGEFIAEAGPGFVPYELLVLLDFPRAVDPELAERLAQLASHAASRGISLVTHVVTDKGPEIDLGGDVTELRCDERGRWTCAAVPDVALSLDPPPSTDDVLAVASRPLPPAPSIEFSSLRSSQRFAASSAEGLRAAVGMSGMTPVEINLDDDTVHGLVAGDTGSGKSNLLRVLIYGLAHTYSPQELELYLLDFKESVEFREFAPTSKDPTYLPHARVVSINSSRSFGVGVLEHLARLTSQRYAALPEGARKVSALREGNPDLSFPRVLAVVDEFQVLFNQGDLLADRAATALAQIASQGRAAGVHLLLSTQSLSDVAAGTTAGARIEPVYKNSRLRVGLRLGEEESRTLLRMSNPAAAEIHERGVGIVNHEDGAEEGNVRARFALITEAEARAERREGISRAGGSARPPRVFEGGRGAEAGRNPELRRAVAGAPGTWIGAPLAVDDEDPRRQPSLFVPLPPDPNRQLAVIGAGARSAAAILQWGAIGFARRCGPGASLLLVDLLREDDGLPSELVEATAEVARGAGATAEVIREREGRALLPRLEDLLADSEAPRAAVVFGFDRVRDLAGLGEDDFDPDSLKQRLDRVLGSAGARHCHLLGWWSTYDAFTQQVGMREATLGLRVYLGMSPQQLQLISPGEMDASPTYPTAYWHDYAAGAAPRLFHLYEPFGRGSEPEFLLK